MTDLAEFGMQSESAQNTQESSDSVTLDMSKFLKSTAPLFCMCAMISSFFSRK